nr:HD domain-containing phosphohydrolase [Candidatus Propionivibrio aalborgensis]
MFGSDQSLTYETWADIPSNIIDSVRSGQHQHSWPDQEEIHRNWIKVDVERLIQIVLPLVGKDGKLAGYLEGVSRLDEKSLRAQRDQVSNTALTAVIAVLVTALLLYPLLMAMLRQAVGLSSRLLNSNLSLMLSLGNAIANRDSDTDSHNYRVTFYAVALAEAMGLPKQDISALITGAFLHDVGKIGIPDSIMLKAGKLTNEKFDVMKTHVLLGIEIVEDNPWLKGAALTIR